MKKMNVAEMKSTNAGSLVVGGWCLLAAYALSWYGERKCRR